MKAVLSRIRHPEHRILTTIKIWYRLFNWFWLCFLILLLILLFDFFCFVWICFEYYVLIDFYVLLGFWIFEGAGFDPKLDLFSHFVVPKLLLVPIAHGFVLNVWTGFAIYRPRPIYICFPKLWLDHPMPWTFFQMKWSGQEFWLQLVSSQSVSWAPSTLNFDYIYSMFLFKRHWSG